MDKPEALSPEHQQQALPRKLQKACQTLQGFEQRMTLIGHHSDQIALKMQQIRKNIQDSMPGRTPSK